MHSGICFLDRWLTYTVIVSRFRSCIPMSLSSTYSVQIIRLFKPMKPCRHSILESLGSRWRAETIWLAGRHSVLFTLDTTVLRCVTVTPLDMFLLAYLFDTCLLIFEGHASWSQSLSICFMVGLRYHWVCRLWKIWNVFFHCLHWCGKCSASTGLYSISSSLNCFSQQSQDVRWISFGWMHSCAAVLFQVQCRLFTYDTFFVCQIARRVLCY